jgi:hypothetical protein
MARPLIKPTKREVDVINKHRVGGLSRKQAMEKLGITDFHVFNRVFYAATMALN